MRTALALATLAVGSLLTSSALARDVPVADATELRAAIEGARAGDVISLADGTYDVTGNLVCRAAGTDEAPIVVRGVRPLGARIRFDAVEGFLVRGPHWRFEDLDIEGVCAAHPDCEHAFHVVGEADFTVIRRNRAQGFNAHIKANGEGTPRVFPDDVLVEENEFFNPTPRMTSNPVTPIDVVGGRRWVVRANFIHDHHKALGDNISYAMFLKGNSRDGLIERNLVVCELLHTGGTRIGLSFGGGGTGPDSVCEGSVCTPEHQNGVMRNNIVVSCPASLGVYVNACAGCSVVHNTLYRVTGIDVRFAASDVEVAGNVVSGRIRTRDGATMTLVDNLEMVDEAQWSAWFRDPAGVDFTLLDGSAIVDRGTARADVPDDYCGNARDDGQPDLGAVEHDEDGPCDTSRPGGGVVTPAPDGGPPSEDAGGPRADAGAPAVDAGRVPVDSSGGADGGGPAASTAGCACRAGDGRDERRRPWLLGVLGAAWWWRRSRGRERDARRWERSRRSVPSMRSLGRRSAHVRPPVTADDRADDRDHVNAHGRGR